MSRKKLVVRNHVIGQVRYSSNILYKLYLELLEGGETGRITDEMMNIIKRLDNLGNIVREVYVIDNKDNNY